MRKFPLLTALAAAVVFPGIAQAAEPPCLTAGEFSALTSYSLPSAITGTAQRCATTLPADAYLRRHATQLAGRYEPAKAAAWPTAKAAVMKVGGNDQALQLLRTMPDATLRPVVDGLIAGLVAQEVPLERCSTIDRVLNLLSPLPAQSTAELVALALGLAAKGDERRIGRLTLCQG